MSKDQGPTTHTKASGLISPAAADNVDRPTPLDFENPIVALFFNRMRGRIHLLVVLALFLLILVAGVILLLSWLQGDTTEALQEVNMFCLVMVMFSLPIGVCLHVRSLLYDDEYALVITAVGPRRIMRGQLIVVLAMMALGLPALLLIASLTALLGVAAWSDVGFLILLDVLALAIAAPLAVALTILSSHSLSAWCIALPGLTLYLTLAVFPGVDHDQLQNLIGPWHIPAAYSAAALYTAFAWFAAARSLRRRSVPSSRPLHRDQPAAAR